MENVKFMGRTEIQKKDKLVRVLHTKLPKASKEDIVKIVDTLNLKRQYSIRVCRNIMHLQNLAVKGSVENKEDIAGTDWTSVTETKIKMIMGNIIPGRYEKTGDKDEYSEAKVGDSPIYAFIQEKHHVGYLDAEKPEYENFLYLYQKGGAAHEKDC